MAIKVCGIKKVARGFIPVRGGRASRTGASPVDLIASSRAQRGDLSLADRRKVCPYMKKILSIALFFAFILASSLASAQEGIITTVAGNGTAGFSGDGGPAILAQKRSPATHLPGLGQALGSPACPTASL